MGFSVFLLIFPRPFGTCYVFGLSLSQVPSSKQLPWFDESTKLLLIPPPFSSKSVPAMFSLLLSRVWRLADSLELSRHYEIAYFDERCIRNYPIPVLYILNIILQSFPLLSSRCIIFAKCKHRIFERFTTLSTV